MIEAPEELAGKVTVQIGAQVVPEPIQDFPHIRSVPVGNVTVKLTAPGYLPVVETVEVKEGEKPATLTKTLVKKKLPEDP